MGTLVVVWQTDMSHSRNHMRYFIYHVEYEFVARVCTRTIVCMQQMYGMCAPANSLVVLGCFNNSCKYDYNSPIGTVHTIDVL